MFIIGIYVKRCVITHPTGNRMNDKFSVNTAGRLDKILSQTLEVSRNQVEKLIKDGLVLVNGKVVVKPSFKVAEGDEVVYAFKEAQKREPFDRMLIAQAITQKMTFCTVDRKMTHYVDEGLELL